MKPAQWMALLGVSAAAVFGITFAVSSLPGRKSAGPKISPQARLTFADPTTSFPAPPGPGKPLPPPAECEVNQPQQHDFWFKNENAVDLPVGLFLKSCQCTSVLIYVAPKDWKDLPEPDKQAQAAKDLEAAVKPVELRDKEEGVVVPGGGVGMLRLSWKGDRLGSKNLAAKIWMGELGPGPTQDFQIYTVCVAPLKADDVTDAGTFTEDQLPQTVYVRCWSSTRKEFPLDVRAVHSRWKEESNPFEVGKPAALTEDELAELRKDPKRGTVFSGYKVPVVLRRRSPDGANAFDLGPFRQRIELKTEGADPISVVVAGLVQGDLGPLDPTAVVRFPPFDRTQEVSASIAVAGEEGVTRLELDRDRTPDFLAVDEESLTRSETLGGRRTWTLRVKWVPKSGAGGVFPRDEEGYRDSAVYVRPVYANPAGPPPPWLRIPVVGKADTPQ